MDKLFKIVRYALLVFVLCFIFGIGTIILSYYYYANDLPKLDTLHDYEPQVASEVYADDGTKIGEFWNEKRTVLSPTELPKGIVQAIVASEDDRFFVHRGIDYQGIVRAFFENLKAGHIVQGGSTITQQVTKSLLLTNERSFARKIKEAILATRIEKNFTKEDILYLYLNQIFLGNRAYGVEAAAQNYFHKSARELNVAEAAMIAGLAKAPSSFAPTNNPQAAKQRQEYVIDRMYDVGYLTKDQAKSAKAYPLKVYRAKIDKEFNVAFAPWFTEYIRQYIQKTYGDQSPYTDGWRIETTADLSMQEAADKAVKRGLEDLDQRQGYAGPIKRIPAESVRDYADKVHYQILDAKLSDVDIYSLPKSEDYSRLQTPLDPDKDYEGVITEVKNREQEIGVLVGHEQGIIKMPDYAWARRRNTQSQGYNGVFYVKDPKGIFNVGDVVYARIKKPSAEEIKKYGYKDGVNYFSLRQTPEVEGALFSYEPQTGYVRAMVGGKDFTKSEYNRAMQALRQTGSVFKPFLYSAALDKGYTPDDVIEDSPVQIEDAPGHFWTPQNYGGGFRGPTTFRSALVNSRNVCSVKILMSVGREYVGAYVRKMGVDTPFGRYYSLALGANDMKLYQVARAFGTFPTGGILPDLIFIKKMTDRHGKIAEENHPKTVVPFTQQLKKNPPKTADGFNSRLLNDNEKWFKADKMKLTDSEKQILYGSYIPKGYIISPKTAYMMVQLMHDIVNFGTGYKVKALGKPTAGKTGTTNDETDTWFVGYVPDLVAGVWVGFDEKKKLGARETGGQTAAPIFLYYMQKVLEGKPVAQFQIPKEIDMPELKAPVDTEEGDAEAGGTGSEGGGGADFFIHDF